MKFEIDIDLPEDVLKEWEPVACRGSRAGEYLWNEVARCVQCAKEASPFTWIILRRRFVWPAWLKCRYLTWDADGVVRGWNTFPSCLRHCWDADDDVVLIADGAAIDLPFPGGDWRTRIEENPNWSKTDDA